MMGPVARRARSGLAILALALGMGCGGGQTHLDLFTTNWSDDEGRSIEALRQRLGSARFAQGTDVAVGVAGHLDTLVGLPLTGGAPWKFAHPLSSRPLVATNVVVASGGGELFALDAATGRRLWARPVGGLELHGVGDDGAVTVVTLSSPTGKGSTLLAVLRDGTVVRQIETEQELGTPAVVSGLAFVPWANQYVSVLDLADGGEVARVVLRQMTSRAWTTGGGLYFGEAGVFRFDEHIKDASRNQATYRALPSRELPGSPKLMAPGDQKLGPAPGAPDKIRLYARPTPPPAPLAFEDDRFYATYFKLVMGFTADKGVLSWVHTHPVDVIGGAASAGGVVLCDTGGKVTVLGAKDGGVVSELDFGGPLASCVVQVDAFRPTGSEKDPGPLAAQLQRALENGDLELATLQRMLLRELATSPDEQATRTLIEVASDPRTSPALLGDARTLLAARRNGARFMVAALERHYDFLKDVLRPPPVGPMAQALAAMNEKGAAPALASHLVDPADTDDDVKQAALALVLLGSPAEVQTLKQFFAMYRDAPDDPVDISDAVVSAGQALLKVGGGEGRAVVDQALAHTLTNPAAKAKLQAILEASDAQNAPSTSPGGGGKGH
jgi:outer membrane protein assembly factor BamB